MEMEFDTHSWKDRCNRYFSSISDAERNDAKPGGADVPPPGKQKLGSPTERDDAVSWKDLADLQQKFPGEHHVIRYIRNTLGVIDVHGAKFGSKARSTAELFMWILIVLAACAAFVCIAYLQVKEYREVEPRFELATVSRDSVLTGNVSVTVCNLNIVRKSVLQGTELQYLLELDNGSTMSTTVPTNAVNVERSIRGNPDLFDLITSRTDAKSFIAELSEDIEIQEVTKASSVPLSRRLLDIGRVDILRKRALLRHQSPTLGHRKDGMLIECWIGDRKCRTSEVRQHWSQARAGCATIAPETRAQKVTLILDVERSEYVDVISPEVGFSVTLQESGLDPGTRSGQKVFAEPSRDTVLTLDKELLTKRQEGDCNPDAGGYKKCLEKCFDQYVKDKCKCSVVVSNGNQPVCDPENRNQYICLKSLDTLNTRGHLDCECAENCRDYHVQYSSTSVHWPSTENLERLSNVLKSKGKSYNYTEIRKNVAMVTVRLEAGVTEVWQQESRMSILELIARLGGLSAFVAGISIVTLGELVWTLTRILIDSVAYCKRSSSNEPPRRRLSDSDITSVTWAMYKQKRREEEQMKEQQNNHNNQRVQHQHVLGGNVPSRIAKRNNILPPVHEEVPDSTPKNNTEHERENRSYDPIYYEQKQYGSRWNGHGYSRQRDRRSHSSADIQLSVGMNTGGVHPSRPPYENGIAPNRRNSGEFKTGPSSRDGRQLQSGNYENISDSRNGKVSYTESSSKYTQNGHPASSLYPERGRLVENTNSVQLYGSSSAYFHSNVSEPMYL